MRTRPATDRKRRPYYPALKRAIDFTAAIALLLLLSPLLIAVAALVRLKFGAPIFFRQKRPGLNGEIFSIVKFRSMPDWRDENGELLSDERRMTRFGSFLRASSIDELPELWNVLKGEMSLVGPRPLRVDYLDLYTPEQARRHDVRPGITGWAQVNGRNAVDWETRFKMDVWYVDHCTLPLDVKILWLTLWKTIRREGISSGTHATMEVFTGSKEPPD